jgi:uncharacterized membrane protein
MHNQLTIFRERGAMSGVLSTDDIIAIFGGLAGLSVGVLALFLFILSILMPLMIYFIHRSTKRTAIATEKIAKQNEQLLNLITGREGFIFGDFNNDSFTKNK